MRTHESLRLAGVATVGGPDKEVLVERVGVVGCGLMGSGIAEVTARAGAEVVVIERDDEALASGRQRIERSLDRAVTSGKLPARGCRANPRRADLLPSISMPSGTASW